MSSSGRGPRRSFRSSRVNRDLRDQAFARAVIATAAKKHNEAVNFNNVTVSEALDAVAKAVEIEVCPDCLGSGEVVRHVSDEVVSEAVCTECNGRGWIE